MSEIREMKPQGDIKEGVAQGGALALPCKENAEAVGGGRGVGMGVVSRGSLPVVSLWCSWPGG